MSELSGPATITRPEWLRSGSVGQTIPGMQIKIDHPDKEGNGEVLLGLFLLVVFCLFCARFVGREEVPF